jgi:hypothetical protein
MKFDAGDRAMLTLDDLDDIPIGERQDGNTSTSLQHSHVAERALAATFVQMAKLCVIISDIHAFISDPGKRSSVDPSQAPNCGIDHATSTSYVTTLFTQRLQSWLADLPTECRYRALGQEGHADHPFDRLKAQVKAQVVLVNMFYYSAICHLHFPQLLKETGNDIGRLYCETLTTSAAADMVRTAVYELTTLAAIVVRNDLIDRLPAAA